MTYIWNSCSGWATVVYLAMFDSEGFSDTDIVSGTDSEDTASSESSPDSDTSMPTPHFYQPSGTESDSSSEHSTSSDDSEDLAFRFVMVSYNTINLSS